MYSKTQPMIPKNPNLEEKKPKKSVMKGDATPKGRSDATPKSLEIKTKSKLSLTKN